MKTTIRIFKSLLLAGIIFFFSCNDEDFEVPTGVKLTLKTSHTRVLQSSSKDTVQIIEAFVGVKTINFKPFGNKTTDIPEKIINRGPYYFDLIKGDSNPEIRWIEVDPGLYRKIEIETNPSLQGRKTMIIEGIIKRSGRKKEIPFEFSTKDNFRILVENGQGISINEDDVSDLLVFIDLPALLEDIDLPKAKTNQNGVLIINDEFNPDIIKSVMNRFTAFGRFLSMGDFNRGLLDFNDNEPQNGNTDNRGSNNGSSSNNDNQNDKNNDSARRHTENTGDADKNKNDDPNNRNIDSTNDSPDSGNTVEPGNGQVDNNTNNGGTGSGNVDNEKDLPADGNKKEPGTVDNGNNQENDRGKNIGNNNENKNKEDKNPANKLTELIPII